MSIAAFRMNAQIKTLANGSNTGYPIRAPIIPIKAPIEDNASERWCHASAFNALE